MQPDNQQFQYSQPGQGPIAASQLPKSQKSTGLIIGFVLVVLLLVAATVFGFWAFMSRADYKNNSDQKATAAVTAAEAQQKQQLDAQFAEQEKQPLKTYTTPSQYGSVVLTYPKTWSAYVVESDNSSQPVDGYFYPNFVPNVAAQSNNYYLRVQVDGSSYASVVKTYEDKAKQGTVTITSFAPSQVASATPGVRINGQLDSSKQGSMVILPLRDKTLKIWTENDAAANDFNTVLTNLTYQP